VTELFADLFVGERQQLGIRQSDPANPEDGEAWLRDDLTDSANDKIGELRWYVGSATNSVPIFDAGTSGTGITEELRVQINGQTGFLPVTQSGAFPEHRIQSGGQTRTLTDTKALDVLFDILSISTNEPISVGEDLLVDYAVENTGSDQGTDDIDLLDYTDTVVDTQTKTLNSNEQTSDQLVWTTSSGDGGDRQITVRSSATSLSKTVSISAIPDSGDLQVHYDVSAQTDISTLNAEVGPDLPGVGGPTLLTSQKNGNNVVSYDGSDDGHSGSLSTTVSPPYQMFFVFQWDTLPSGNNFVFISGVNEDFRVYSRNSDYRINAGSDVTAAGPDNNWHVGNVLWDDAGSSYLRIDGTQVLSGDAGTVNWTSLGFGYSPFFGGNYFDSKLGEMFGYPQDKSNIEADAEQYLADKWAITI